jgi:hypothetical protein
LGKDKFRLKHNTVVMMKGSLQHFSIFVTTLEKEKPFNYEGFSLKLNGNELGSDSDKP